MKIKIVLFSFYTLFIYTSCQETGPHPSDMVGNFEMSILLKDDAVDKNSIKENISSAISEASKDLEKAKKELSEELSLDDIDTSNLEGKIEFAAKSFGKSISEVGINFGNMGKDLGSIISDISMGSIDIFSSSLKNLNLEIEFQEDGDIKNKGSIFSLGLKNATWEVKGDNFIFTKDDGQSPESLRIIKRDKNGFTLEKEKVLLEFVRINNDQ